MIWLAVSLGLACGPMSEADRGELSSTVPAQVVRVRLADFDGAQDTVLLLGVDLELVDDTLYVADAQGDRISRFDTLLQPAGFMGREGAGPGEIDAPLRLAARDRLIAVAEMANQRISLFHSTGRFIRSVRVDAMPRAVALGPAGQVMAAPGDADHHLRTIDSAGRSTPFARRPTQPRERRGDAAPRPSPLDLIVTSGDDVWVFDNAVGVLRRYVDRDGPRQELRLPRELAARLEHERAQIASAFGLDESRRHEMPLAKELAIADDGVLVLLFRSPDAFGALLDPTRGTASLLSYPRDSASRAVLESATGAVLRRGQLTVVSQHRLGIFRLEVRP